MESHTLSAVLFWIVAGITGICAIGVVVTQHIVRSATWLLFTLAGTAGVFFLLGADFVGAAQLLVYVGGTLVLVVFGVMLTAQGPFVNLKAGAVEWGFTTIVGVLFLSVLAVTVQAWRAPPTGPSPLMASAAAPAEGGVGTPTGSINSAVLGQALLGLQEATPEAKLTSFPTPNPPQRTQMSYLLPFEIVSVHLLVVLIGAAYLARAKRRRGAVVP